MPSSCITSSSDCRETLTARVAPIFARQLETVVVDVGDDDVARADVAADRGGHDADRAGAGDQHVLADQIERQRGVGGVAERVEDRGDLVGDCVGQLEHVGRRHHQVLGEAARPVDADAARCCGTGGGGRRGSCGSGRR